jgi:hypothetical protein
MAIDARAHARTYSHMRAHTHDHRSSQARVHMEEGYADLYTNQPKELLHCPERKFLSPVQYHRR